MTDVRERLAAAFLASDTAPDKAAAKLASQGKLYVRDRIALLLDEGSFVEDGRYANAMAAGLPADGVVTLVWHSVVRQYMAPAEREQVLRLLETFPM